MTNFLSPTEREKLLTLAREAIAAHLQGVKIPDPGEVPPALLERRGCFVCIKSTGKLRGCIGNFTGEKPLAELIQEMAISAATKDPRFYPMRSDDLQDFSLEISVLTPLRKISSPEEIIVGEHGLYIEKNFCRGVLLPQVAVEYGWDRDTFLNQTSIKAGMKPEDWKEGTDIFVFSAEVFSEQAG